LPITGNRRSNDLVGALRLPQPAVSKHLSVLRRVRLVTASRRGRRRIYRLNAGELKTVHDWVKHYERFWTQQLSRIKAAAEERAREPKQPQQSPPQEHP
jgi:DNA-binding transcriptional ArsR family regulator